LTINGKETMTKLMVTGLGKQKNILGFPWLDEHNPDIKWKTRKFTWQTTRRPLKIKQYHTLHPLMRAKNINQKLHPTPNDKILLGYIEELQQPNKVWINMKTSNPIEFHLKYDEKKEELPLEQLTPEEYHEYLDVFDEGKADQFPGPRPWDHKIELKEGFQPKSFKTYNLTRKSKRN
jgi:hypothetical protein